MGQDSLADTRAVEGSGFAQNIPIGQHPQPVSRVGHIEIENVGAIGQTEIDDLAGAAGRLHENVVHGVGIAQVLVDDEGVLQNFQPQGIPPIGQPLEITHRSEGGQDVVDVGFGHADAVGQLRHAQNGLLNGEAGEDVQCLGQGFDLGFSPSVHMQRLLL